jgi:hypothetical protein
MHEWSGRERSCARTKAALGRERGVRGCGGDRGGVLGGRRRVGYGAGDGGRRRGEHQPATVDRSGDGARMGGSRADDVAAAVRVVLCRFAPCRRGRRADEALRVACRLGNVGAVASGIGQAGGARVLGRAAGSVPGVHGRTARTSAQDGRGGRGARRFQPGCADSTAWLPSTSQARARRRSLGHPAGGRGARRGLLGNDHRRQAPWEPSGRATPDLAEPGWTQSLPGRRVVCLLRERPARRGGRSGL